MLHGCTVFHHHSVHSSSSATRSAVGPCSEQRSVALWKAKKAHAGSSTQCCWHTDGSSASTVATSAPR